MKKTAKQMKPLLESLGKTFVSLDELNARLAAIGYKLDRSMDAWGDTQCLRGPLAGISYVSGAPYVVEMDTGISFAHWRDARRDDNFKALQDMRGTLAVMSRAKDIKAGRIVAAILEL